MLTQHLFFFFSPFQNSQLEDKKKEKERRAIEKIKANEQTMRGFMNGLPLQALFVLWIVCTTDGAPYSSEF